MRNFIFGVALGAIAGSLITYYIKMEELERKVDEEVRNFIRDYEDHHNAKSEVVENVKEDSKIVDSKSSLEKEYKTIVTDYNKISSKDDIPDKNVEVIKPEDFGEDFGYDCTYYTLYSDGIVCDENDEPIDNEKFLLGNDWKDAIGRYETDLVYVRNHIRKMDIEISVDTEPYKKEK